MSRCFFMLKNVLILAEVGCIKRDMAQSGRTAFMTKGTWCQVPERSQVGSEPMIINGLVVFLHRNLEDLAN